MKFRRAIAGDADALSRLAINTFTDAFASANRPSDVAAFIAANYTPVQMRRDIDDPGLVTLLADDDGALAAFAQIRPDAPNANAGPPPAAEIKRFYVSRDWHGRGLAQSLMRAVADTAIKHNVCTIWLGVWEHNARAIAFYRKLGFSKVGDTQFMVGSDRQCDWVMATSLASLNSQTP